MYRPAVRSASVAPGHRRRGSRLASWLVLDAVAALIIAALRRGGDSGRPLAIVQLIVVAALIIALALLLEQAVSRGGRGPTTMPAGSASRSRSCARSTSPRPGTSPWSSS